RLENENTIGASWSFEDDVPLTILVADTHPGSTVLTFVEDRKVVTPSPPEASDSALAAFQIAMILTSAVSGSPDNCCACPDDLRADLPVLCFAYRSDIEVAAGVVTSTMEGLGYGPGQDWSDQSVEGNKARFSTWLIIGNARLIVVMTDTVDNGKYGLVMMQSN